MPTRAAAITRMTSLFFGILLLMVGMMLLNMGLAIKVPTLYGDSLSGLILSIHYVGLIVGAIRSRDLILRIGHIRAFAAFATVISAVVVFYALVEDPWIWMLLRLMFGLCFGGLIAIFEGWISDAAEAESRGLVVSFYQFVTYFGQAIGMLGVNFVDLSGETIFLMASIMLSISLVPIVLTRVNAPNPDPFQPKGFGELFGISPLAISGAVGAGLLLGTLYALTSTFLLRAGFDTFSITLVNIGFVVGGMLFQIPLAMVADKVDRRLMLLLIFLLIIFAGLAAFVRSKMNVSTAELFGWFALLGGGAAMIYPVALARAYDYLKPEKYVSAASAMVMAYSAAAFVGPTIGGFAMQQFGTDVFLPIMVLMAGCMALFTVYRMVRGEAMSVDDQEDIVVMPNRMTTTAGLTLDPRTPEEDFQDYGSSDDHEPENP